VIWWSFEGDMEVWREKFVFENEGRRRKNLGYRCLGVAQGRVATGTGRANSLDF